ncbi:MAG: NAD-dependent epimerase/dehydratase family protein [Candidatus Hodarchaeota archaeon]
MVYLITGGTGLVGSFLVEIIADGQQYGENECKVIVRSPESKSKIEKLGLTPIKADLNNPETLKTALKDVDVVFNLAALADDWVGWSELFKVNVEGVSNLIKACRESSNDPFLAHTSSTGVYGHYIPEIPIDESYKFNPTRIYQKSKYYQEKVIWETYESEGWDNFGIIRPPSVIGPRDTKTILPIFKAIYERKFPILRNGMGYITFIHPFDLNSALLLLGKKREKSKGQAYNLKSFECLFIDFLNYIVSKINPPKPPKRRNYQLVYTAAVLSEIYARITGKKTTLNRYRVTKFAYSRRYNDQKIRNKLGFEPKKTMEVTIDESYEWLIQNKLFPPKF